MKYCARAGRLDGHNKGDQLEDLKKARWYIDREINRLEDQEQEQKLPETVPVSREFRYLPKGTCIENCMGEKYVKESANRWVLPELGHLDRTFTDEEVILLTKGDILSKGNNEHG